VGCGAEAPGKKGDMSWGGRVVVRGVADKKSSGILESINGMECLRRVGGWARIDLSSEGQELGKVVQTCWRSSGQLKGLF